MAMTSRKDKPGAYALKDANGNVVETFTNRAKLMKAFVEVGGHKNGYSLEQTK